MLPVIKPVEAAHDSQRHDANAGVPLLIAHGTQDPVVQLSRGQAARDALVALGYPVAWHTYPMEHSVCMEEVQALAQFLRHVLAEGG